MIQIRLEEIAEKCDLLQETQMGFRKYLSTVIALIVQKRMMEDLSFYQDSRFYVILTHYV